MKKILQIFLIATLSLSFVGQSYGQEADTKEDASSSKNTEVEKPADKIKIKEDTKTLEEDKGQAAKETLKDETKSQDEADSPEGENRNAPVQKEASKSDKEAKVPADSNKKNKVDYEKVEKAVDDLVEKLDKNSNLSKALEEVKVTIKVNNANTSSVSNQVNKQTEKVIRDYSQKIQEAKTPSQKKELENEAASKIKSISIDVSEEAKKKMESQNEDEPKKRLTKEVKVNHDDDIGKIYALAPAEEEEKDYLAFLKKPVIIIGVILVLSIVITIGIVIKNKEKEDIDSY
ncbi:hypothetical protein [uncultured Anaerococcus sp.]|uniref:hypothetical protein n=1 Tax=uncultured Anaerococcus sp. TaxID=293428 RepID=UPI00288ADCCC|nr:hypothetical protein [uncultured Anaerococcus sp.]